MGSKGIVASTAALGVLLQEGIGDTIRISLTPEPGGDRTLEDRHGQPAQARDDMLALLQQVHATAPIGVLDWLGTSMGGLIGMAVAGNPELPLPVPVRKLLLNQLQWKFQDFIKQCACNRSEAMTCHFLFSVSHAT